MWRCNFMFTLQSNKIQNLDKINILTKTIILVSVFYIPLVAGIWEAKERNSVPNTICTRPFFPFLPNKVSQNCADWVVWKRSLSWPDDHCSSQDNEGSSKSTASSLLLTGNPACSSCTSLPQRLSGQQLETWEEKQFLNLVFVQ